MTASNRKDVVIVGGGISGLSALHFIRTLKPTLSVTLYEKEPRLGGTVGTDHVDGYSLDWGPNGFLDREPLTLRMVRELGIERDLERAGEAVQNRFILRDGTLQPVPMSPVKFFQSGILSVPGRLRVMMEPFGRKAPDGDESVYDFAKRRIGREAADYLVQPMVSGVYGGMADRLSLQSTFKIMHDMEAQYGSLVRAMIAKAREARKKKRKAGGPAGPGGWLTSFKGGLYKLIEQCNERYRDHIVTGTGIANIIPDGDGYVLTMVDGSTVAAKAVILATPAYHTAEIVRDTSGSLASVLDKIEYSPIAVVCFGYDKEKIKRDLDGFGFLVPRKENRRLLGSIWTSSIFENRAPEGKAQFRSMVGGDGDHEVMDLTDGELIAIVRKELNDIVGLWGDPELVRIYRWQRGIPQFKIGHSERMAQIENELDRLGNLYITGNAYYGIGLNDCIKQSFRVAEAL